MKKVIAITLVAVMMLFACSISAFAEISPTAEPKPNDPSQDGGSSTSPQTGDVAVYVGLAALFVAAAGTVLAVKKIKQ